MIGTKSTTRHGSSKKTENSPSRIFRFHTRNLGEIDNAIPLPRRSNETPTKREEARLSIYDKVAQSSSLIILRSTACLLSQNFFSDGLLLSDCSSLEQPLCDSQVILALFRFRSHFIAADLSTFANRSFITTSLTPPASRFDLLSVYTSRERRSAQDQASSLTTLRGSGSSNLQLLLSTFPLFSFQLLLLFQTCRTHQNQHETYGHQVKTTFVQS